MAAANVEGYRFDFAEEIKQVLKSDTLVQAGDVVIWGGEFNVSKLLDFLAAWDLSERYCIWEYAHRIEFVTAQEPNEDERALLEHGRVFGTSGDLNLRRDGARFLWHFIGVKDAAVPSGFGAQDFGKPTPDTQLHRREDTALLWGQRKENDETWQEDRVGWATLNYPGLIAERVQIKYEVFTENGQPAFVWWKELEKYA